MQVAVVSERALVLVSAVESLAEGSLRKLLLLLQRLGQRLKQEEQM